MHPRVRRISVGVLSITPVYRGLEFLQHLDLRPAGHHAEKDAYGSSRRVSRQRLRLNDLVKNSPTTEVEIADGNIELIKSLERCLEVITEPVVYVVKNPGQCDAAGVIVTTRIFLFAA